MPIKVMCNYEGRCREKLVVYNHNPCSLVKLLLLFYFLLLFFGTEAPHELATCLHRTLDKDYARENNGSF